MSPTLPPQSSFAELMDALYGLEQTVHERLTVYRWRPVQFPQVPALWNWPSTDLSPVEKTDIANHRDRVEISAYIGVKPSDSKEEMRQFEQYVDAARAVIDPGFNKNGPLDGVATRAFRRGFRPVLDDFSGKQVLCIELPLELHLNRILTPTP
jgi:hypothetical protein